jgi:LmbE family N-acetylglucosaminyl deacetylase
MKTIYISPHLDDAIFSCGGWIWEQTRRGQEVEIWTICAGDLPPGPLSGLARSLHQSWNLSENAVKIRREEDRKACQIIGAVPRHFSFLDCIYRISPQGDAFYETESGLFGGLDPREMDLIDRVRATLADCLPEEAELIVPLGIGNHVDHELTRKAASRLEWSLSYYADYPYAREIEGQEILTFMEESREWQVENKEVSEQGLDQWWQGARAYASQITTFWEDEGALRREIKDFSDFLEGMKIWKALEEDG